MYYVTFTLACTMAGALILFGNGMSPMRCGSGSRARAQASTLSHGPTQYEVDEWDPFFRRMMSFFMMLMIFGVLVYDTMGMIQDRIVAFWEKHRHYYDALVRWYEKFLAFKARVDACIRIPGPSVCPECRHRLCSPNTASTR